MRHGKKSCASCWAMQVLISVDVRVGSRWRVNQKETPTSASEVKYCTTDEVAFDERVGLPCMICSERQLKVS